MTQDKINVETSHCRDLALGYRDESFVLNFIPEIIPTPIKESKNLWKFEIIFELNLNSDYFTYSIKNCLIEIPITYLQPEIDEESLFIFLKLFFII